MSNLVDDISFDFKCPTCNQNIQIKTSNIGNNINCPNCNQLIELQDDGLLKSIDDVNESLNSLFNTLDSF